MKSLSIYFLGIIIIFFLNSCNQQQKTSEMNIIFLHHSTGAVIWKGDVSSTMSKTAGKISERLAVFFGSKAELPQLFEKYNRENNKDYHIKEQIFPKAQPYGWNNYPYDYYNIWVKNAGDKTYMEEPTLELLTSQYNVIIFKHCFPSSNIEPDHDSADINSDLKTLSNYKLQYLALRTKLHEFPQTKFILFTGAVNVKNAMSEEEASRSHEFYKWVKEVWDLPDDNVFLWDLYKLQTEGGLYFKDEYAVSTEDSHPNVKFAGRVVKLLFNRIIDVVENNGTKTFETGEKK